MGNLIDHAPIGLCATMHYPFLAKVLLASCGILALQTIGSASAQIIPDSTLPANSVVPGGCVNCDITGGTQQGGNLFHSFGEFSIPTGGSALFVHGADVNLIFGRVTGDLASDIDGLISTSGVADLFLLNPNGILFGPNAAINVGGSFVVTSASGISFADGTQFVATSEPTSLLTVTAPVGLQFGTAPGDVVNQSNAGPFPNATGELFGLGALGLAGLQGAPDETVALIGGEVRLEGGNITVPSGHVELGSVASNSTVRLQPSDSGWSFDYVGAAGFQDITLSDVALVDLSDLGFADGVSGSAHLQGQNIVINGGSGITGFNFGAEPGGMIQVDAAGQLLLQGARLDLGLQSTISTYALGSAAAGDLQVNSQNLQIADGGSIASVPLGGEGGNSGNINVQVQDLVEVLGSAEGAAPSAISIQVLPILPGTVGDGQTLEVNSARLLVSDGGQISSTTFGEGQSGSIDVTASESIQLIGEDPISGSPSGIFTAVEFDGLGNAGSLDIQTAQLEVLDGAQIQSSTRGATGNGGALTVNATEFIRLSGTTETADLLAGRSGIFVAVDPASINRFTGELVVPTGNSGNLLVTTPLLMVESGARISADTFSSGIGGDATLNVGQLQVLNGGEVRAGSRVEPDAPSNVRGGGGQLNINASERVEVTGSGTVGDTPINSILFTAAEGTGAAGNIVITTPQLVVSDSGEITTSTAGLGAAGQVIVTGNALNASNGGRLLTTTSGAADSGSIILTLQDELSLTGNGTGLFANTEAGSTGNGGSIIVDPILIQLNDGALISVSSLGTGTGGNIVLTGQVLSLDDGSQIVAETASDLGGNITLNLADLLLLSNGSLISATAGLDEGAGDGGNITINLAEGFIIGAENTDSDIIAQAFEGTGGNIRITAQGIFGLEARPAIRGNGTNDIDASSQFGESGTIVINDPTVDPSGANVELPADVIDASDLVDRRCQADAGQGQSSLIVTGRGGLPPDPSEILRSDEGILTGLDLEENNADEDRSTSYHGVESGLPSESDLNAIEPLEQIIEAQTWERNEAGQPVLMAALDSATHPENITQLTCQTAGEPN